MVTFGGNFTKTYLKRRIHILGSGKLERAFTAFVCATGDLCRPLRAELVCGGRTVLRIFHSWYVYTYVIRLRGCAVLYWQYGAEWAEAEVAMAV